MLDDRDVVQPAHRFKPAALVRLPPAAYAWFIVRRTMRLKEKRQNRP
jgi:hypothetical protein